MILTVTLNAAVDKTYCVENFSLDRVHRTAEWRVYAGGKGLNVARVYHTLGGTPVATGFLGGYNGRYIARSAREEGIDARFVRTAEESRVCIAVVDPVAGTQTEVNEVGPTIRPAELKALRRRFRSLLRQGAFAFVTLSGSIPPGVHAAVYADLGTVARDCGVRCVLDASGDALRLGCEARPWMLKPNAYELETLVGIRPETDVELAQAARALLGTGTEVVCVTLGRRGCIAATAQGVWKAAPPPIRFVSAVGSGDSFLGAYLYAVAQGACVPDALRLATAAGAANAEVYGSGFCSAETIRGLSAAVRVEPLA